MRKILFLIATLSSFFFFGCASKGGEEIVVVLDQQKRATRYKPIIGSRNSDARMGVDVGVVLKGWVAPYKTKTKILIAGHDVYFWVEKPDFITGTAVPQGNRGVGAITPLNKLPFSISPKDIDRGDIDNNRTILEFLDNAQGISNEEVEENVLEENKTTKKQINKVKKIIKKPKKTQDKRSKK